MGTGAVWVNPKSNTIPSERLNSVRSKWDFKTSLLINCNLAGDFFIIFRNCTTNNSITVEYLCSLKKNNKKNENICVFFSTQNYDQLFYVLYYFWLRRKRNLISLADRLKPGQSIKSEQRETS